MPITARPQIFMMIKYAAKTIISIPFLPLSTFYMKRKRMSNFKDKTSKNYELSAA
jgi:hypothetical protein